MFEKITNIQVNMVNNPEIINKYYTAIHVWFSINIILLYVDENKFY